MLRCIFKIISKYGISNFFQIVLLLSNFLLNNGYKFLLMKIKYFLLIKLIPNFYDMYIIYSQ